MRVAIVGGVFGRDVQYRSSIAATPEMTLARGLRERGVLVDEVGHSWSGVPGAPDLVHVHHLAKGVLPQLARRWSRGGPPLVFTRHAWGQEASIRRRAVLAVVERRADAVVVLSTREGDMMRPRVRGEIALIPNGVVPDTSPVRPVDTRGPVTLLFVGQLIALKGVDVLLRALAARRSVAGRLLRLRLVFHNDALRPDLEALARDLGVEQLVEFVGPRAPHELVADYDAAGLLVLPSWSESLPSVVLEALLRARPVVASDVGGISDEVGPAGRLVPPGDPQALADAIEAVVLAHESYARSALARAAVIASEYSVDAMVEGHLELYRRVLRGRTA